MIGNEAEIKGMLTRVIDFLKNQNVTTILHPPSSSLTFLLALPPNLVVFSTQAVIK
jgi:hypothetical protein